jgi:hypothetical protein
MGFDVSLVHDKGGFNASAKKTGKEMGLKGQWQPCAQLKGVVLSLFRQSQKRFFGTVFSEISVGMAHDNGYFVNAIIHKPGDGIKGFFVSHYIFGSHGAFVVPFRFGCEDLDDQVFLGLFSGKTGSDLCYWRYLPQPMLIQNPTIMPITKPGPSWIHVNIKNLIIEEGGGRLRY